MKAIRKKRSSVLVGMGVLTLLSGCCEARVPCTSTEECESLLRPGSQCTSEGYCDNPYQYGCLYQQQMEQQYHNNKGSSIGNSDSASLVSSLLGLSESSSYSRIRICNSEDPIDAHERGLCRPQQQQQSKGGDDEDDARSGGLSFDYKEIRLMAQNWESPFFAVWILQILLSEVLDVPVTIETGVADKNVNFYHPDMTLGYGVAYDTVGLERASHVHDCTSKVYHHSEPEQSTDDEGTTEEEEEEEDQYMSCGHAIMEHWNSDSVQELKDDGLVEAQQFSGVIGEQGWLIPKFTARKDATLSGYFGLMGEENRRKLAERFLRPTTWKDYCDEVDPNHCLGGSPAEEEEQPLDGLEQDHGNSTTFVIIQEPPTTSTATRSNNSIQGAATRPPQTPEEEVQFFAGEGLYVGHFRKTEENDCDRFPTNCTGHYVDYPCGWTSYFLSQSHHLNVALKSNGDDPKSGGYSYSRMVEIWKAANYTKSDVIGHWWRPDGLYQQFQGTDMEFQRVNLPPPNHQCMNNRPDLTHRCGDDPQLRVGESSIGSCDSPPVPLHKVLSTGLYKLVYGDSASGGMVPDALRSPAYDVVKDFVVDGFDLGEIFTNWYSGPTVDAPGFGPRDAVCRWVAENFEDLQRFIPRSYPRELQEIQGNAGDKFVFSLSVIALVATLVVAVVTYWMRSKPAFRLAQIEFVYLLLAGMLLVSTASLLTSMSPTDGRCVASIWLVNVGYTMELCPLVVKIAAINYLMRAAKRMKRVKLSRKLLLGLVAVLTVMVVLYMTIWTVLDPPSKTGKYKLTGDENEDGRTIVTVGYSCGSKSSIWMLVSLGGQTMLLLCASVLAFLTRKTQSDVNEANILSFLIYWNFVCVLIRTILLLMEGYMENSANLARYHSLVLSLDSLFTIGIYFVPKFLDKKKRSRSATRAVNVDFGGGRFNFRQERDGSVYGSIVSSALGCGQSGSEIQVSEFQASGSSLQASEFQSPSRRGSHNSRNSSVSFAGDDQHDESLNDSKETENLVKQIAETTTNDQSNEMECEENGGSSAALTVQSFSDE